MLEQRLAAEQETIAQVQLLMKTELARYGFHHVQEIAASRLRNLQLRRDDFDGNQSLYGEWHDALGQRFGSLLIHGGGQVYAELDVLQAHPTKSKWFVESITLWGRSGALKSDLNLLPALND